MPSFRDRRNPEAIRFPSDLRVQVLIVSGLAIDLLCAVGAGFTRSSVAEHAFDVVVLLLLALFKMYFWPREIVADQFGLHSLGLLARRNHHIPWKEVGEVRASTEVPLFGPLPFGLRNDTLEFHSQDGTTVVVHTSHHPDRDRLVREVRLHGITLDDPVLP